MPTDTERREVARRLRENAEAHPKMSLILNLAFADDSLKPDGAMEWKVTPHDAAHRLADLIEPEPERTCRVGCYPPGYEDNLHYEVCSECGTILTASRPGDRHAARASYCPRCGARVVDA